MTEGQRSIVAKDSAIESVGLWKAHRERFIPSDNSNPIPK